ncbi:MAG: hypothetical protein MPK62_02000 [Alphaproteobacteria bacterium]|nr:hypothetical protein [Alphaproteobacteria bacterium]MDA8029906.1 hypothetical protein [Alphaproteobacteria bacterium]
MDKDYKVAASVTDHTLPPVGRIDFIAKKPAKWSYFLISQVLDRLDFMINHSGQLKVKKGDHLKILMGRPIKFADNNDKHATLKIGVYTERRQKSVLDLNLWGYTYGTSSKGGTGYV